MSDAETTTARPPPGVDSDAALHVVQSVLLPREGFPAELYLRVGGEDDWSVDPATGMAHGAPGTRLDFDTYFNAHFPAYWQRYTTVQRIALRLRLQGVADLSVRHCEGSGPGRAVLERRIESAGDDPIVIWLADREGGLPDRGRLGFTLTLGTECRIDGIDYVTDAAPVGEVRLSIGICTFNRESYLSGTLDELASLRETVPGLAEIIVVNQGDPLAGAAVRRALRRAGARLVVQPNLGGAGGFCRTMYEALSADATHHLLMDDDIHLDSRMIDRALDLLKFLAPDKALGGSMFETDAPTRLYEAGARVVDGWIVVSNGRGTELAKPRNLAAFDRVTRSDYNAWWFCILPLSGIRSVGLPMPVFFHGDDIEYGCRLRAAGIETVAFPGLAVWHESFAAKSRPWVGYYDLRNVLINSALHAGVARPFSPLDLLGWIFHRLTMHQYESAWAMTRAAADFLAGADGIVTPTIADHHAEVTRIPALDRKERAPDHSQFVLVAGARKAFPSSALSIAGLYLRRFVEISLLRARSGPVTMVDAGFIHPGNAGPGPYATADPKQPGGVIVRRPHLLRLWIGSVRALWVALRFLVQRRAVTRHWRERAPSLASEQSWVARFEQPDLTGRSGSR